MLFLADPDENMLDKYLEKGDMFVLEKDGIAVCEAVVEKISDTECELKNIATREEFQKRGFASKMIDFLFSYYCGKFSVMLVGTAENGRDFYSKQGFEYSHTVKDFFVDNYPEPVIDNGVLCVDMIYFRKIL
jgi:Acetyltransferases